jgi:hypothetical protein
LNVEIIMIIDKIEKRFIECGNYYDHW